jgi:large repetitive protein
LIITITVSDTTTPTWSLLPTDQSSEYGFDFAYQVIATDLSSINAYWLNDTTYFAIDFIGLITNLTDVPVGIYSIEIRAYDVDSNYCSANITITITDTTAPTWDQTPTDQVVEFGVSFRYDVNASDLQGISTYWLNDTNYFDIDSTGLVTNATIVPVGIYSLGLRVYDVDNNYCSANIAITIVDTTLPIWLSVLDDTVVNYGAGFSFQFAAYDLSGIGSWNVNDEINFTIEDGLLSNITTLASGIYNLSVTVDDIYGNNATVWFTLTVLESTITTSSPTTTTTTTNPSDFGPIILVFGGIAAFIIAIIILFLFLMKRRESDSKRSILAKPI